MPQHIAVLKSRQRRCTFKRLLNMLRIGVNLMLDGRLFHVFGAVTTKARSPLHLYVVL